MSLKENVLRDLYGDDLTYEYHQDYRDGELLWRKYLSFGIPSILLIGAIIYSTLYSLDYNLLSLSELIWNWIVYLTPSRLIDILDKDAEAAAATGAVPRNAARTHAAKSEIMRRVVGLDKPGGIMGTVAQASRRRLSTLPGIKMAIQGEDGRPAGLGNWDNSCYQNSVLQGLASLDSFSNYLKGPLPEKAEVAEKPDMKMADSLRGLIAKLKDPSNNGKRLWTPAALKSMSSWQQQDAQEYFSKVLDEIDKEIEQAAGLVKKSQGLTTEDQVEPGAEKSQASVNDVTPTSSVRNPLEGMLAQRVGCTRCGYSEGLSMIPFICLTVPLGKSWNYDISQCLDEYTKLEAIEGVQCGKCTLLRTERLLKMLIDKNQDPENPGRKSALERLKVVQEALEDDDYEDKTLTQKCKIPPKNRMTATKSRQAVVARPPKSLVIHVNRSMFDEMTGELKKNYAEVKFQNELDLGPWCLGSNGRGTDDSVEEWLLDPAESMIASRRAPSRIRGPIYQLRAVVTHYGRHENGHYVAYRKHPVVELACERAVAEKGTKKEQWWRLSDDDVSQVSEENVLNQGGVFMLFYDLVGPSSLVPPKSSSSTSIEEEAQKQTSDFMEFVKSQHPEFLASRKQDISKTEQTSIPMRRQESEETASENTVSEDGKTLENSTTEDYEPARPIHVKPFVHTTGMQHEDGERNNGVQGGTGSMVMV